ncbi:L-ribulose-5-phosphate 3-epimerase [Lachnotalea glycerini]|uniref:L-ribulose-5-phosphate 3-epimerase n=1 Tax=Lachnotalea glycerini TaxID=1763509 RepID=A0A318EGD5_9FIRM|nr:L-ribulose-5-phosphate 3-epimerase [Lachnotalea glycerini]OYO67812.1 L-ribulose-5-phosphate 4-epimerase [Lachnotalea glycerini]PXV84898.1 L-ribulose-5-phosphate 3-epimerase [Lachnotalea glycerini]
MKAYTLGIYEKALPVYLTWQEKLEIAKDAGYDFLEISIDESDEKLARLNMSREERLELVKTMYEVGIPIRTMCLSGHRKYPLGSQDPKICKYGMEIMEKAIQLADDLGIRIIQLAGYDVYYEESTIETRKIFEHNLRQATLMSARAGVLLGFETMETEFMNTVEKSMKYVSMINSTYLNVYPDAGNITNAAVYYGTSVEEDLKSGAGHITSIHLKETVPGKFREISFGSGHVNFESVIKTAWELGIRKYVTEFWYIGQEKWKEDIFCARKMIGDILDKQMRMPTMVSKGEIV